MKPRVPVKPGASLARLRALLNEEHLPLALKRNEQTTFLVDANGMEVADLMTDPRGSAPFDEWLVEALNAFPALLAIAESAASEKP